MAKCCVLCKKTENCWQDKSIKRVCFNNEVAYQKIIHINKVTALSLLLYQPNYYPYNKYYNINILKRYLNNA